MPAQSRLRLATVILLTLTAAAGCSLQFVGPPDAAQQGGEPTVVLASPLEASIYRPGIEVVVQARITAAESIRRVVISVDGEPVDTIDQANPSGDNTVTVESVWPAEGNGSRVIDVAAERADGAEAGRASVTISVLGEGDALAQITGEPALTTVATASSTQAATVANTRPPTRTPVPTVTSTASGTVQATFVQPANVRSGPGLAFAPPIGAFNAGDVVEVLARNPVSTWYRVRFGNGSGWVSAALVSLEGNIAGLPVEVGPPPPTPAPTATPPPTFAPLATNTPIPTANLVAGLVTLLPSQPVCGETFVVAFDVANLGTTPTLISSTVSLVDMRTADGTVTQSTIGGFPILQPNQTFRVEMPLTVNTFYEETHTLTLIIDPANEIPESQEGDNQRMVQFVLRKGDCP